MKPRLWPAAQYLMAFATFAGTWYLLLRPVGSETATTTLQFVLYESEYAAWFHCFAAATLGCLLLTLAHAAGLGRRRSSRVMLLAIEFGFSVAAWWYFDSPHALFVSLAFFADAWTWRRTPAPGRRG